VAWGWEGKETGGRVEISRRKRWAVGAMELFLCMDARGRALEGDLRGLRFWPGRGVGLLGGGGRVGLRTGAGSGGRAVRYGGDVVGSMKEKEEGPGRNGARDF